MGGRGGSPNTSALGQAQKQAVTPVAPGEPSHTERLKPWQLTPGMRVKVNLNDGNGPVWVQIGSIRNRGRAGRLTSGQFVIRDKAGDVVATISPNGTLLVDRSE